MSELRKLTFGYLALLALLALTAVAWPQAGDYSARCFMLLDVRDY